MYVQLWDDATANLIDEFEDMAEALFLLRGVVATYGPEVLATWALDRNPSTYATSGMIRGQELLALLARGE